MEGNFEECFGMENASCLEVNLLAYEEQVFDFHVDRDFLIADGLGRAQKSVAERGSPQQMLTIDMPAYFQR